MKLLENIDPSIVEKRERVSSVQFHGDIPLFSVLELNLVGACNRSCDFCPVSFKDFYKHNNIKGIMTEELFSGLVEQLKMLQYKGQLLFSGYSEPLLHKRLEKLISISRLGLPEAHIEINTNGDLLTAEKIRGLYDAGLSSIKVSLYDDESQYEAFEALILRSGVPNSFVKLRRRFLQNGNLGLIYSNRGGAIADEQFSNPNQTAAVCGSQRACYYPFYMMKVDLNGDVLMCSHDWQKEYCVGNVLDKGVLDIWMGKKMNAIREELGQSKRITTPCCNCSVIGTVMGDEHYRAWSSREG